MSPRSTNFGLTFSRSLNNFAFTTWRQSMQQRPFSAVVTVNTNCVKTRTVRPKGAAIVIQPSKHSDLRLIARREIFLGISWALQKQKWATTS